LVYLFGLLVRFEYLNALLGFLLYGLALFTSALSISAASLQQFWFLLALVRSVHFLAAFLPVLLLSGWFCRRNPLPREENFDLVKVFKRPKTQDMVFCWPEDTR